MSANGVGRKRSDTEQTGIKAEGMNDVTDRPFHYQREHFRNSGIENVGFDEDAPRRVSASNYAAAFNALMIVSGIISDMWHGLHILLDKTRGFSQTEWVELADSEAGALMPGDKGVSDAAKAKRWKRFWDGYDGNKDGEKIHYDGFEDEQKRLGKRIAYREAGKAVKRSKFDDPKLIKSRYKSSFAQMIVDVVRHAGNLKDKRINGKKLTRKERFEEAAIIVWNLLPEYDDRSTKKIKQEPRTPVRSTQNRCLNRLSKAAREMIASAENKEEAVLSIFNSVFHEVTSTLFASAENKEEADRLRFKLHAEIETLFADASDEFEDEEIEAGEADYVQVEESTKMTKNTSNEQEIPKNRATFFEENHENIEQSERFSLRRGDNFVHLPADFEPEEIPPELVKLGVLEWKDGGRSGRLK